MQLSNLQKQIVWAGARINVVPLALSDMGYLKKSPGKSDNSKCMPLWEFSLQSVCTDTIPYGCEWRQALQVSNLQCTEEFTQWKGKTYIVGSTTSKIEKASFKSKATAETRKAGLEFLRRPPMSGTLTQKRTLIIIGVLFQVKVH